MANRQCRESEWLHPSRMNLVNFFLSPIAGANADDSFHWTRFHTLSVFVRQLGGVHHFAG